MKRVLAAAAVLSCGLVASCGDQSSDEPPPRSEPAQWRSEHLAGETSVDFPTLLVTADDDALVVMLSDDGVLQTHLSLAGAGFEAGEPLDLGERYAALGDVVRLDDGSWLALGNAGVEDVHGDEQPTYDPLAVRSDDGLTWERVEVAGFTDAVEVSDLEVVAGRIVAVGSYRTLPDPGSGGFEARAWTSADGRSFREVRLPGVPEYRGYDDESYAGDLVAVDGALLASGRIGDAAAMWRSKDGGATWTEVDSPAIRSAYSIGGVEVQGSTVVAVTSGHDVQAVRSVDGGDTWEPVTSLPVNEEADGWAPLWSGGGRFLSLTGIDDSAWSAPEVCYADLDQCGRDPGPRVVASTDGADWSAVDLPGPEVAEIAGTADGRLLVAVQERDGLVVHTWPADAELPAAADPAVPQTVELVTLEEGRTPEVGLRYHLPLFTHCGVDWIYSFGDSSWHRTDAGPDYETGAGDDVPDGWPVPEGGGGVYGYATVRDDGVLEYTTEDGTVLATYERRAGAPGCD